MDDTTPNLDLHLTLLVGWAVNLLGKAVALGVAVGLVLAAIGATTSSPDLIYLAGAAVPLTAGLVLYFADAPFPVEVDDAAR